MSPGLELYDEVRFLLDDEKKVVMLALSWLDLDDKTESRDIIYIVGEDNEATQVDLGTAGEKRDPFYILIRSFNCSEEEDMGERKEVSFMLPIDVRCNTCGNYMWLDTYFNGHREEVIGETYLGTQILRFYFKCTNCSSEVAFKTDLEKADFTVEAGATSVGLVQGTDGDEET
ncbi:unnamed protein product [Microthlaspi erraticum]|uniref:Uncharacterized protein n=1 Tax=Microthlaspi erraticum TaxID=1685480 RepID=A0A6D2HK97_9BRAS|nr:unnamed protein product [Microthlaspi erraticum]